LMYEYIITMTRNISVLRPIPRHFFTFIVGCLVFQYFLIARRAQLAILVRFTIHHDICDLACLRVHYFPDWVFHLIRGASLGFCVARFECDGSRAGSVFLGNIVVLLLEFKCHRRINIRENECKRNESSETNV